MIPNLLVFSKTCDEKQKKIKCTLTDGHEYITECHWVTGMVKEPGYTYSSPNTIWINVVHKYNRRSVMTTD